VNSTEIEQLWLSANDKTGHKNQFPHKNEVKKVYFRLQADKE
jgi:hypothetical protein